jgi:hypothetical protein
MRSQHSRTNSTSRSRLTFPSTSSNNRSGSRQASHSDSDIARVLLTGVGGQTFRDYDLLVSSESRAGPKRRLDSHRRTVSVPPITPIVSDGLHLSSCRSLRIT